MGISIKQGLKLLLAFFFISCFRSAGAAQEIIRLATEEYPPYTSKDLANYGVASHIVTDAFALEGVQTEYSFFPGARALLSVKSGSWDGSLVWTKAPDRLELVHYSDPLFSSQNSVFFHLKTTDPTKLKYDPHKKNYASLKGLTVGGIIGYGYGANFEEAEQSGVLTVSRVTDYRQNFEMLLRGRINLVAANRDVGYFYLNQYFTEQQRAQISDTPHLAKVTTYYLILSKKTKNSEHYLQAFNRGLQRLKTNGSYEHYLMELGIRRYAKN